MPHVDKWRIGLHGEKRAKRQGVERRQMNGETRPFAGGGGIEFLG